MSTTRELFDSMTVRVGLSGADLAAAVDVLQECAESVTACAAAMLTGADVAELASAVSFDMDCVDVVETTRRLLTRNVGPGTALLRAQLKACLMACERSNEQCAKHAAHHAHCRICADSTGRCANVCRALLTALHG